MNNQAKEVKTFSIKDLNALINELRRLIGDDEKSTDEALSIRLGKHKGYLTQTKSRGVIPEGLMEELKKEIKILELQNAMYFKGDLNRTIGDLEERMLRAEGHLSVFIKVTASLLAQGDPLIAADKEADLLKAVQSAVNRRLDELRR